MDAGIRRAFHRGIGPVADLPGDLHFLSVVVLRNDGDSLGGRVRIKVFIALDNLHLELIALSLPGDHRGRIVDVDDFIVRLGVPGVICGSYIDVNLADVEIRLRYGDDRLTGMGRIAELLHQLAVGGMAVLIGGRVGEKIGPALLGQLFLVQRTRRDQVVHRVDTGADRRLGDLDFHVHRLDRIALGILIAAVELRRAILGNIVGFRQDELRIGCLVVCDEAVGAGIADLAGPVLDAQVDHKALVCGYVERIRILGPGTFRQSVQGVLIQQCVGLAAVVRELLDVVLHALDAAEVVREIRRADEDLVIAPKAEGQRLQKLAPEALVLHRDRTGRRRRIHREGLVQGLLGLCIRAVGIADLCQGIVGFGKAYVRGVLKATIPIRLSTMRPPFTLQGQIVGHVITLGILGGSFKGDALQALERDGLIPYRDRRAAAVGVEGSLLVGNDRILRGEAQFDIRRSQVEQYVKLNCVLACRFVAGIVCRHDPDVNGVSLCRLRNIDGIGLAGRFCVDRIFGFQFVIHINLYRSQTGEALRNGFGLIALPVGTLRIENGKIDCGSCAVIVICIICRYVCSVIGLCRRGYVVQNYIKTIARQIDCPPPGIHIIVIFPDIIL